MSQFGEKATLLSVLEYLKFLADSSSDETAKTQLSVAHDMLSETFGIQSNDPETFRQHSYFPLLLPAVFQAGVRALGAQPFAEAAASVEGNPTFQTYLKNVTSKAYFQGTTEGSIEYLQRYAKVVQKFKEKLAAAEAKPAQAAAPAAAKETKPAAASPAAAPAASSDNEAQAEAKKNEGNDALRNGDHQTALRLYSEAIQLSPAGPQSHIYYCNRAAAHCHLENYSAAVSDCNKAINLKPDYSKAYSRLGFAHFHTANYEEAEKALKKAVELDPSNKQYKDSLKQAQDKLQQQRRAASAPSGGAAGGAGQQMPDLSSLAGMLGGLGGGPGGAGGAGGLSSLLQNPAMMQMAQQVMSNPAMMQQVMGALGGGAGGAGGAAGGGLGSLLQNPAMMQMAQQAMQDPEMMAGLAGMMGSGAGGAGARAGGAGAAGAGGSPFSPDLLQRLQSDPRVATMRANPAYSGFFSAIERGDITSAIQAAQENPELMQTIQGLLQG